MQLPEPLRRGVEQELAGCDAAGVRVTPRVMPRVALRAAAQRLSEGYRAGVAPRAMNSAAERAAYLAVRLPATYAAVLRALEWTRELAPELTEAELRTVLDLGSGPGTALWAAAEVFPSLAEATAVERDTQMLAVARRLAAQAEHRALREAAWIEGDMTDAIPEGRWDVVLCSYALNELAEAQRAELIRRAWDCAAKLLVIVEPGTRAGFANVLRARERLLALGAKLVAPCPHERECPMAAAGDWCHFAARVERTGEHRRLKQAQLGHEDEKFSYAAFFRETDARDAGWTRAAARIVRHPRIFSGYAQLTLCAQSGLEETTVTRSQKDDWRRLKRLGWGDRW
jgi:ribosomal protein RSM22 (predicted rRNA methylase)